MSKNKPVERLAFLILKIPANTKKVFAGLAEMEGSEAAIW